jgi:hypothetical protein
VRDPPDAPLTAKCMASEVHPNVLLALTGAMESVLELSGAGRVVEIASPRSLETLKAPPPPDLPDGVRPDRRPASAAGADELDLLHTGYLYSSLV